MLPLATSHQLEIFSTGRSLDDGAWYLQKSMTDLYCPPKTPQYHAKTMGEPNTNGSEVSSTEAFQAPGHSNNLQNIRQPSNTSANSSRTSFSHSATRPSGNPLLTAVSSEKSPFLAAAEEARKAQIFQTPTLKRAYEATTPPSRARPSGEQEEAQRDLICRAFNEERGCRVKNCPRPHVCLTCCGSGHAQFQCRDQGCQEGV